MSFSSVCFIRRDSRVVVVALLGLLRGRSEVGRVGRHGELFLDAGVPVGPPIRPSFAKIGMILRRWSFSALFSCLFVSFDSYVNGGVRGGSGNP